MVSVLLGAENVLGVITVYMIAFAKTAHNVIAHQFANIRKKESSVESVSSIWVNAIAQ